MNEVEKRRKRLLEQTRNLYQDERVNPAVHPRYKAAYGQLYPEEKEYHKSSFGIRCMICIFAFVMYMIMGMRGYSILGIDDLQVQQKIMQNYTLRLY